MGGNANAVPGGKDKKGSQGAVEQRLHSEACPLLHISSTVQYGSGYYEDDDVSLNELIRRERIEGVQDTVWGKCEGRVVEIVKVSTCNDWDIFPGCHGPLW